VFIPENNGRGAGVRLKFADVDALFLRDWKTKAVSPQMTGGLELLAPRIDGSWRQSTVDVGKSR
jgi:hypothetical protein